MSNMRTVLPVKRNQPLCVAAVLRQLLYTLKSLKHPAQRAAFDAALCSVQFAAFGLHCRRAAWTKSGFQMHIKASASRNSHLREPMLHC